MALEPYFIVDREALLSQLRLNGIPNDQSSSAIVDAGILVARRRIFTVLGSARAIAIEAIAYDEEATDADGITRITANELEAKLIRVELYRTMPTQFTDGNEGQKAFNEEGLLRELSGDSLNGEIRRLESEIDGLFESLKLPSSADEQGGVAISVIGPDKTNTYPGADLVSGFGMLGVWESDQ